MLQVRRRKKVSWMPKCLIFYVCVRIAVKSVELYEEQGNAHGSNLGVFRFLGAGHVPKCPEVLCVGASRNAPIEGASAYLPMVLDPQTHGNKRSFQKAWLGARPPSDSLTRPGS
jgi:hypothetical protein